MSFRFLALLGLVAVGAAAQAYTLGAVVCPAVSIGNGGRYHINNSGFVSGDSPNGGFVWDGALRTLAYKGYASDVHGINNLGTTVGTCYLPSAGGTMPSALLWTLAGAPSLVDSGGWQANGEGVNDNGDVAMYNQTRTFSGVAVSRIVKGKRTLYRLGGGWPTAINNACQVLANSSGGLQLWTPNSGKTSWQVVTIPGAKAYTDFNDLNDSGCVVGQMGDGTYTHPFVFTRTSGVRDLMGDIQAFMAPPSSGSWSWGACAGVNNVGLIVGRASNGQGESVAWVYRPDDPSSAQVVSASGWAEVFPQDINDVGQIVAIATNDLDGQKYCVLLNP